MFKEKLSVGLILLLLITLGGCQAEGTAKDVVFSQELEVADEGGNASHSTPSIRQAEAVEKAEAAFGKYFDMKNIDQSLVLKAALIEDDGILWMSPYWKLSWLAEDAKKPVYSAEIDAQTGEVVQLRYQPKLFHKIIYREDVLACQDTALAFIDQFALLKEAPLTIFEASSSYFEGILVEFRYGPDRFVTLYFNEAGDVSGFAFSQQVAYTLQGDDLKVDRAEAIEIARASIKQYFDQTDTSGLIEKVQLVEGNNGEKTWFVYWKNIAVLDNKCVRFGAQIDALSGTVCAVEGVNHPLYETAPKLIEINETKLREIADRFMEQKNLSDYRFEAFDEELGALCYRSKVDLLLQVYVDRFNENVCFLSFVEFK